MEVRQRRSIARAVTSLAANPGISLSAALGPAVRQAVHRITEDDYIGIDELLHGHIAQSAARASGCDLVVVAQDTTVVQYEGRNATIGLGPVGTNKSSLGVFVHSALAMTQRCLPLGVVHCRVWARDPALHGKREKRRMLTVNQKESRKWLDGLAGIESAFPPEQRLLVVQDREADIFAFLRSERRPSTHLLIRAAQPRRVEVIAIGDSHEPRESKSLARMSLFDAVSGAPELGTMDVDIPLKPSATPQPAGKERIATLTLQVVAVDILAPRDESNDDRATAWIVQAQEKTGSPDALSWTLISTQPVETLEQAIQTIGYYKCRWQIERLHFTLKTGLQIEKLQIDDVDSLAKTLAIYWVTAWRLMHVLHLSRAEPEKNPQAAFSEDEITVLDALTKKQTATLQEAILKIAKLGGYEHYRNAPAPGIKSLWQGLRYLEAMVAGWLLAKQNLQHV